MTASELGTIIREYVTTAISAITPRLAAVEARLVAIGDLRDRVITVETKSTVLPDLATELRQLRDRLAAVEVRISVPGPAGPPGAAGKDGALDGLVMAYDGQRTITFLHKDGTPVEGGKIKMPIPLWQGVFGQKSGYEMHDQVLHDSSLWLAREDMPANPARPGEHSDLGKRSWMLQCKRGQPGRDGKDAQPAPPPVPVVSVRRS